MQDIPLEPGHPSAAALDEIAAGWTNWPTSRSLLWGPRDPVFSDLYLRDLIDRMPHADVHRWRGLQPLRSRGCADIRSRRRAVGPGSRPARRGHAPSPRWHTALGRP